MSDARDPLIGKVIGARYHIRELLSSGGTATVYRAHHSGTERAIALKVQHTKSCPPSFPQRFEREAKMAARLDHPNIVTVLDSGRDGDLLYLAMELVVGTTLTEEIKNDAPMSIGRVTDLMVQILGAVSAAHDVGIIHRDIKPANVLISVRTNDDGAAIELAKVCDFGVAKVAPHLDWTVPSEKLTQSGALIGTPHYMSPEQAGGDNVDERTDIYSCGVMMYEMATGSLPFDANSVPALLAMQMQNTVIAPSSRVPRIDRELERIIMRAMSKQVDQRYENARAMRRALKNLGNEETVQEGAETEIDLKSKLRGAGLMIPDADTVREDDPTRK